jgi:hypothetical protein
MSDRRSPRPRHPRLGSVDQNLRAWAALIAQAERSGIPVHDQLPGDLLDSSLTARANLQQAIDRNDRRGRRVAAKVYPLDERWRLATVPSLGESDRPEWWWNRSAD